MPDSHLQEKFLQVFATSHKATANRIVARLEHAGISSDLRERLSKIVHEEIRGLYHGNLVVFFGGSSLAEDALIEIVDEDGTPFNRHLHEIGFKVYDQL